jgi:3-methyl-2-oxobutanoate hydroxymethyltransferase
MTLSPAQNTKCMVAPAKVPTIAPPVRVGIALGSNLGDRAENLRAAFRLLSQLNEPNSPLLWSSIYETEPVECAPGTPSFLNATAEIGYSGTPYALLDDLRKIENKLGRLEHRARNTSRTIDLDILYFSDLIATDPDLSLPHPRLAERRFVLAPLSEIRPELILPGHRMPVKNLLANLTGTAEVIPRKELLMARITPDQILRMKMERRRIACLTAYDYSTAKLLDEAGLDLLLVGDSLGMTVLGHPDTTSVELSDIVHHTRPVARGAKRALVASDLPIGTYDNSKLAVESSRRLLQAGAQAVKLEGGMSSARQIEAITGAGIPLLGHIGMLPQHIREEGRYRIKGRTKAERLFLFQEAEAVERAGAFAVVLELVHPPVAAEITAQLKIPTIGIGSGESCDGEILVFHDLVGYFPWFTPKHVRPLANVGRDIAQAAEAYVKRVQELKPTD